MSQEVFDKIVSTIPMGRIASPREIASAFLFLASDLSSFVTGATIDVNGGMYIRRALQLYGQSNGQRRCAFRKRATNVGERYDYPRQSLQSRR